VMGSGDVPEGVGRTAVGMALVRAEESRRPDRLFDDPYAEAFVAAAPDAFADEESGADAEVLARVGAAFACKAIIRTRFYDDDLLRACDAGCRQIVLVAAGLDTRAFRLPWPPGVRLFEVDLPDVLAFKERVLSEREARASCERVSVAADLRGDWSAQLTADRFDPTVTTAWLAEGLLIYLSADEAARLLTAVGHLSARGSRVAFEHGNDVSSVLMAQAQKIPSMARFTTLWKGGLGEDPLVWLERHGWQATHHDGSVVAASYGRVPPGDASGGFVTAVRAL